MMESVKGDSSDMTAAIIPLLAYHHNAKNWFLQVESIFSMLRISSQRARFANVMQKPPSDMMDEISDVLSDLREHEPVNVVHPSDTAKHERYERNETEQALADLQRQIREIQISLRPRTRKPTLSRQQRSRTPSRERRSDQGMCWQDPREVFQRLSHYGLKLNLDKCVFGTPSVDFLGHHTDANNIAPLPDKISSIRDFPTPTSIKQLRRFLGMMNLYRRFIQNCATILQPLTNLQQKKNKDIALGGGDALHAFHTAKNALANFTRLSHINDDPKMRLSLTTDASDEGVAL
ncbi:unnamed protein product [Acanthosepion pharaonis]|uniref:Reverse transcriptase/retrotransposon-derived protein RNase H-like domain-containing protein n=1 Tax=Acanthosepion pharaonis TaxID=158019 RepID=A0A812D6N8_ACAPH|nr:unnamed protein product [Sepia pharaonis]